ncbi:hypothetical protein ACMXYX_06765 [Neptuniibacter sp. QD72_48]|uniref:hypothetical protein n=1 Tax=unclassified Neptuniibacter TaxID=2630693 RepID=UPI0039F60AD9
MELTKGTITILVLAALSISLFSFMLFFRAFVYADMYIAPNNPYGISDIIELLLGFLFLLLSIFSGVVALVLLFKGVKQSKIAAFRLIGLHLVLYSTHDFLHSQAALLSSYPQ